MSECYACQTCQPCTQRLRCKERDEMTAELARLREELVREKARSFSHDFKKCDGMPIGTCGSDNFCACDIGKVEAQNADLEARLAEANRHSDMLLSEISKTQRDALAVLQENIEAQARLKESEAARFAGLNALGAPRMSYASKETRLNELERIVDKAVKALMAPPNPILERLRAAEAVCEALTAKDADDAPLYGRIGVHPAALRGAGEDDYEERTPEMNAHNARVTALFRAVADWRKAKL